ncbi:hypothetical protein ILYODFUR_010008 [Ilyodon furcidens]|uniref:Uncharacterized protein n=1 Tax=Ilyodon furcidens TaxID=33524 RepID=A0ABV0TTE5_9TELE
MHTDTYGQIRVASKPNFHKAGVPGENLHMHGENMQKSPGEGTSANNCITVQPFIKKILPANVTTQVVQHYFTANYTHIFHCSEFANLPSSSYPRLVAVVAGPKKKPLLCPTLTHEQDTKKLDLLCLRRRLTLNPEGELYLGTTRKKKSD